MDKLQSCPFCGGKGDIAVGTSYGFSKEYEPHCRKCGVTLGIYSTEAEAIAAWNRRHNEWIVFSLEYDEDTKTHILSDALPEDEQEILVTDGKKVWLDTFLIDGECYLDSGVEIVLDATHWMPLPEPPGGGK